MIDQPLFLNQTPLIAIADVDFDALLADDSPNLIRWIKRLEDTLNDPDGIISAFQSFASSD